MPTHKLSRCTRRQSLIKFPQTHTHTRARTIGDPQKHTTLSEVASGGKSSQSRKSRNGGQQQLAPIVASISRNQVETLPDFSRFQMCNCAPDKDWIFQRSLLPNSKLSSCWWLLPNSLVAQCQPNADAKCTGK